MAVIKILNVGQGDSILIDPSVTCEHSGMN